MINRKQLIVLLTLVVAVWSCQKSEELPLPNFLGFIKPPHFPEPIYSFSHTTLSRETFELGRKLFYDERLSRNNTISCASCHIPQSAFTHYGHDVSHGIDDQLGIRNAPSLVNLAWSTSFFWDGGVPSLDLASIAPIHNTVEMDEKASNIVRKLKEDSAYTRAFKAAFGEAGITENNMYKALAHFMTMLISADSKYDKYMQGQVDFTADEQAGYTLFMAKCNSCHTAPLFTDYSFRDNGLGINPAKDLGRYEITLADSDKLKFKVPTLRNLKYTAPYMHDGRIYTLKGVLDHYAKEIMWTDNLDPILKANKGIPLTDKEKEQLLAFLNTLNDDNFIQNKSLRQP